MAKQNHFRLKVVAGFEQPLVGATPADGFYFQRRFVAREVAVAEFEHVMVLSNQAMVELA